jgi:hypothetical protein
MSGTGFSEALLTRAESKKLYAELPEPKVGTARLTQATECRLTRLWD